VEVGTLILLQKSNEADLITHVVVYSIGLSSK